MTPDDRVRAAVAELADALLAVTRESRPDGAKAQGVELLSVSAFARRAGIGRSSAYLAVADGSVRSLKLRGRRLIAASELARLADSALPAASNRKPARVIEATASGQEGRRRVADRPTA